MRRFAWLAVCAALAGCNGPPAPVPPTAPALAPPALLPSPSAAANPTTPIPTNSAQPANPASLTITGSPSTTANSTPAPNRANSTPVATRLPEPTATPATVHISNSSGQPVYLFNSPTIGDRIQTYPEGTPLLVIGGDVEGDGLTWHFVRAPDGTEGYIPVDDTLAADAASP